MDKNPCVILIHGLYQTSLSMRPLAYRLQKQGFDVQCYNYHSLKDDVLLHTTGLKTHIDTIAANRPIYFVAHSLGGFIVRHFLDSYVDYQVERVVTLGTPHLGSTLAHYAKKFLPVLIDNAFTNALDGNCPCLPHYPTMGIIAGNKPIGIGQPLLHYHSKKSKHNKSHQEHDGTVYVFETALAAAQDHIVLPVSHTGMLIDKNVAKQTAYFLSNGVFLR